MAGAGDQHEEVNALLKGCCPHLEPRSFSEGLSYPRMPRHISLGNRERQRQTVSSGTGIHTD